MGEYALISELRRSSSELVIRYVVEPVGLRIIAIGFEIYAVGFLLLFEGLVRRLEEMSMGYIRWMNTYRFKHIKHPQRNIQIRYIIPFQAFEIG